MRPICTLLLAAAVVAPVFTEDPPPAEAKPKDRPSPMERYDTDKDGALSAAEIAAIESERFREKIKTLDTDADGAVSAEEFKAMKPREDGGKRPEGEGKPKDGKPKDGKPKDGGDAPKE